MYTEHFSKPVYSKGFMVLCSNNEQENTKSETEVQVGKGQNDIRLITPTAADVERAREDLKRQHINTKKN